MARKSIKNSYELAELIRNRRNSLKLTIEEAAKKAGVGSKTWSRYEAGEAISEEKIKGLCSAMKWSELPDPYSPDYIYGKLDTSFDIEYYRKHHWWSDFLESCFGEIAATSFVMGAEIIGDYINLDMRELASMPKGSHIGQIDTSMLEALLPRQFIPEYDYDFLFHMKASLNRLCLYAQEQQRITAHSVMDEILLMLMVEMSEELLEDQVEDKRWKEWIFDLMDDCDTEFKLYSGYYIEKNDQFHFDHLFEDVFWMNL